jgi:hypothetical protein
MYAFCNSGMACRNLLKFCMEVMPYVTTLYMYSVSPYTERWSRDGCPNSRGGMMTPLAVTPLAHGREQCIFTHVTQAYQSSPCIIFSPVLRMTHACMYVYIFVCVCVCERERSCIVNMPGMTLNL